MSKKKIGAVLIAASLAILPLVDAPRAFAATGTLGTYNGTPVQYNIGTNGCTGTPVVVFGSSALKNFVLQAATDYCNTFSNKSAAPDVEYATAPAGDSCPGVDYAADNTDGNEIGGADVFAPACTGAQARSVTKIGDTNIGPNVVESIAQCPGANEPQGGSPNPPATQNPCLGNGSGAVGSRTFAAPADESVQSAQVLWQAALGDYAQIGGTAGVAPFVQQRTQGSGTRATWCNNVFGAGLDLCTDSGTDASTTGVMIADVCGSQTGGAGPTDPSGAIGYSSRSSVVAPTSGSSLPLAGCGLVALGGHTGYNGACSPLNPTATPSLEANNPESNAPTCNGDLEVATGAYVAWGYEHLDVNAASSNNAAAKAFITFATNTAESNLFRQKGFMENCQMLFTRSVDAGPYSPNSLGASC